MTLVGLDTGVFVAGVFWRHEPHACVEAWFRGLILHRRLFDSAPKAQHSAPAWGSAPGFVEPQNNVSAESAIHSCLGLRNHLLN